MNGKDASKQQTLDSLVTKSLVALTMELFR